MSLQPAIPWRVGLHQSPPPLHRPGSECITVDLPVDSFAASGQQCLIRLSQPRGPPHSHTDIFRAGIAESGAYNRSLTPYGFQNEERTYWQDPELYTKMSPFSYADKIKTPLVLIHGEADD